MLEELETAGARRDLPGGVAAGPTPKDTVTTDPQHPQQDAPGDTLSPLITTAGVRASLGPRADLAYPPLVCRPGKMVNRSQNTDPDIFEFEDGREGKVEGEAAVALDAAVVAPLKRAGPCVFPEEELSQGGRDVNENVGALSEAASA